MFALPVVTMPLTVLVLEPLAFNDNTMVLLLMVRVSAVALVAVAAFDITMVVPVMVRVSAVLVDVAALVITMVVPLAETTVVPAGMPVPEMGSPTATPLRLDTPVTDVLPEVVLPVGVAVPVVAETIMVPAGMPVPEMGSPAATPLRLDTPVTDVLPEVVKPVGVTELVAVDAMVVPEAMPVPEMGCPAVSPAMLDTADMVKLPVVTTPVIMLEPVPRTVVPVGMPAPVMGCPTRSPPVPAAYEPVMATTALPEVTLPVMEATWLEAVAGFDIVMVLPLVVELTAVMVVLAGMPPTPLLTAMVKVSTILVVRATGAGLLTVAAFDITMVEVLELDETMVVPDGMPVPEMGWPAVTPMRVDNPVMDVLPAVR
jgi:hypothetical protein